MAIIATTWSTTDKESGLTLSESDLRITCAQTYTWLCARAVLAHATGKHYWEIELQYSANMNFQAGVADASIPINEEYGFIWNAGAWVAGMDYLWNNGTIGPGPNGYNGTLRFALDLDAGYFWIGKEETWYGGGDPAAGTNPSFTGVSGNMKPCYAISAFLVKYATANFGGAAFARSVPSGFNAGFGVDSNVSVSAPELSVAAGLNAAIPWVISGELAVTAVMSAAVFADFSAIAEPLSVTTDLTVGSILKFIEEANRITYECILTGDVDGLSDLTLPISSFQGRFKSGDPSYLAVVVPGMDYDAAISARSNGDLIVRMVKTLESGNIIKEEICRVDLEDIYIYSGDVSQSIVISGHRTVIYASKSLTLVGSSYKSVTNGLIRYRCSPHLNLRAGDTVNIEDDSFIADQISIYVSADQETMEVAQAGA